MATVAFTYNGSNIVTATINDAVPAQVYSLVVEEGDVYPDDTDTAVGTTLVLSVSTASPSAALPFSAWVQEGGPFEGAQDHLGGTIFQQGSTGEYVFPATWAFDGVDTVTVTATFANGVNYQLQALDAANGGSNQPFTGTGASQLVTLTMPGPAGGDYFLVEVFEADAPFGVYTIRFFTAGVAGSGTTGSVTPATSPYDGVSIAFDDTLLEATPTWTRIDNQVRVSRWEIRRGRQGELEKTNTAEATVFVNDVDGWLDASNPSSPWTGTLDGRQLAIARWNPVTEEWSPRFRGYIEEYGYDLSPSQSNQEVAIRCVGFMDYLASAEMVPGAGHPGGPVDMVFYDDQDVNDRIALLFDDAQFPVALTVVFSGNVVCQETLYDPGYAFLAGIQDAADAEFPGVANVYEDRFGRVVFHGRHARFDPDTVAADAGTDAWDFQRWKVGDGAAIAGDADYAQLRPPLASDRSIKNVINSALVTPLGIDEDDVAGQIVTDAVSIAQYGVRSFTATDLRVLEHKTNGDNALQQTAKVADYYVTNYAVPQTRPRQITLRSLRASDPRADATWAVICGVDVSDIVHLKVTNPGGGGYDQDFYVEGITESSAPLGPFTPTGDDMDLAEVVLDVSPVAFYNEDTFTDDS